ncbi:MAG: fasciclin domain-containing protein, partial [Myxococcota bacterium]
MPSAPTVSITVTDDDNRLGPDADRTDRALDQSGQTAEISRFGVPVGNDGQIYVERLVFLIDESYNFFKAFVIEQEGSDEAFLTFFGRSPAPGASLKVGPSIDSTLLSLKYSGLGAGDLPENIVSIAAGNPDFSLLVRALEATDLVDTLAAANDITVFAPTNAAFAALAAELGFEGDPSDEDAVFGAIAEALSGLAPDGDPIPLLTDVLLYHVSGGAKTAAEIDAAEVIETLQGATFATEGAELIDNEPDIENPEIVASDILASNGTLQVLDRVLLPIDIPGNDATPDPEPEPDPEPTLTLTGIVAESGGEFDQNDADFDILLNAVTAAGLADALADPEADLTVFAPTDAAFIKLAQTFGFKGEGEGAAFDYIVDALTLLSGGADPIPLLTDVLLYHVAPTSLESGEVLASATIETLLGVEIGVDGLTLVDKDPDVADPTLIATDIEATNGIAHVIDGVLLPADLPNPMGFDNFVIGSDRGGTLFTLRGDDLVSGKGGRDIIKLGTGNDLALGGDGNDRLAGERGKDTLLGEIGNDALFGGRGMDTLDGGAGRDLLVGGKGDDMLTGGKSSIQTDISCTNLACTRFRDFGILQHRSFRL